MKKNLPLILKISTVALFLLGGLLSLFVSHKPEYYELDILGTVLIGIGLIETLMYFTTEKHSNIYSHDLLFAIGEICLGLVFIIGDKYYFNVDLACILWGSFEIVKGLFELLEKRAEIKEEKAHIIPDVLLTLLSITFGVLLIVHSYEGIKVHLIVTAIVLISYSVIYSIRFFILEKRRKHHEKV